MPYDPTNNPYIPGDPYSYDLKWMVDQIHGWKDPLDSAERAKASEEAAKASEQQAEAWAVGTIDGDPVAADEPQYENNSKYWSDEAADLVQNVTDIQKEVEDDLLAQNAAISVLESRMDSFTNLSVGSTTGDAELIDARIGYNGRVWPNAGDAVRGQIDDVNLQIDPLFTRIPTAFSPTNAYINADTGAITTSSAWKRTTFIYLKNAKRVKVVMPTFNFNSSGGMAFYSSNNASTYISGVKGRNNGVDGGQELTIIEVPAGANYMLCSCRSDLTANFYVELEIFSEAYKQAVPDKDVTEAVEWEYGSLDSYTAALVDNPGFFRTSDYICLPPNAKLNITVNGNKVFVFEFTENYTPVQLSGTLYLDYTVDSVHTFANTSRYTKLLIRENPINTSANISIVKNSTLMMPMLVDEYINKKAAINKKAIEQDLGYGLQMFKKIGVIGDSISVGWAKDKNGNNSRRNVEISWPQQMARRLGCSMYNLGASGVDPIEWFDPTFEFYSYCYPQYQSVGECDLYIIGLGLNLGTLGSISDINASDYTLNAATFYGQYARIIQMINDEHPDSIVICLTEPTTAISAYDQAVRDICALNYIDAILLDLDQDYTDDFNTQAIIREKQSDNLHYTPYGYSLIAQTLMKIINGYIAQYPEKFKYVGVKVV